MIHHMKLHDEPFQMIKNGYKDIEMRLNDEKRQKIKKGDKIIFTNTKTQEQFKVHVVKLHKYNSFKELYQNFHQRRLGYYDEELALPTDMEKYYLETDIEKYGVVGIEVVSNARRNKLHLITFLPLGYVILALLAFNMRKSKEAILFVAFYATLMSIIFLIVILIPELWITLPFVILFVFFFIGWLYFPSKIFVDQFLLKHN